MLTKDLGIASRDFHRNCIVPDRLTSVSHANYPDLAERMLEIYRRGQGCTRKELHRAVRSLFDDEPECPLRRIDAFCKLLDDAAEFDASRRKEAAALRRRVYRLAAPRHPLVAQADGLFEHSAGDVRQSIAESVGRPWSEIEQELFADVMEFHRLQRFNGYPDARSLLSRYNVSQLQVALFDSVSLDVWSTSDFKRILQAARLSQLMHTIRRTSSGRYHFRFDGPATVLRETRRYGVAIARFLPSLLTCRDWKMHAVIETRHRRKLSLDVCDSDGFKSHLPPDAEFDSELEAAFAAKWGAEPRDGWLLRREGDILHNGQKTFVPDFVFRHADGRTVFLEIVGFWTPEYIAGRLETHAAFQDSPILLAVHDSAQQQFQGIMHSERLIAFKSKLQLKPVLEALNRIC